MSQFQPRVAGHRICRKCRTSTPLEQMSEVNDRLCQRCVDERVPVLSKQQRNRARNKAFVELARMHKEDFEELYQKECNLMRNENGIAELMAGLR